jgi:methionyl-tRNA formyltransferase
VVFIGSKRMGLRCVTAMHDSGAAVLARIISFDDRDDGRNVFPDLHRFGEQHRIPVTVTHTGADLHAAVRASDAELAIVCGWYSMIPADTLAEAPRGFLGVHNSLLPRYRGGAPLVWAMLQGEPEVGLSVYTLTSGMDDGDIWAQTSTPIGPDDYIGPVLGRLEDACEEMIRRVYPQIVDGTITPVPQDGARATYGTLRNAEHGRIDWRQSADCLYRWIRAQSAPYPGAFTSWNGRRLTIWKAHPFHAAYYGRAGEIARGPSGEILVVCGDDRALIIDEVQTESGERSDARGLLRARTVLGDEARVH